MAGTRLWIQLTVVLELLALFLWAAYVGLCGQDDLLCSSLPWRNFHQPKVVLEHNVVPMAGISWNGDSSAFSGNNTTMIRVPSVLVAVVESDVHWQGVWERWNLLQGHRTEVLHVSSELLQSVCEQPELSSSHDYNIWTCPESMNVSDITRVTITSTGATMLYPSTETRTSTSVEQVIQALFPFSNSRGSLLKRQKQLHLQIIMEQNGEDWKEWARAVDTWKELHFSRRVPPCLQDPTIVTDISFEGTVSQHVRPVITNDNLTTVYQVSATDFQDSMSQTTTRRRRRQRYRSDPTASFQVILYIPSSTQTPWKVINDTTGQDVTAWMMADQNQLVTLVDRATTTTPSAADKDAMVQNALDHVMPMFIRQCMGWKTTLSSRDSQVVQVLPAGAVPSWHVTLWWQRILFDTHQRANEQVLAAENELMGLSFKVAMTQEVAQQWQRSIELMQQGHDAAEEAKYMLALEYLEASITESESLRTSTALMEPLDLPMDHYMAVFAPLLFPLMVPMIAGLIREFKRYRTLTAKSKAM